MSFEGSWRVREHVFDLDGQPIGTVRQRRILESTGPNTFRLTQHCTPDPSLDGHPMAKFAGTHVFDLEVDGTTRRYLGPAVVGTGQMLGDTTMWGEGIWPIFGHGFQSYSVSLKNKQLTGGIFSNGTATMAHIVGIAQPETDDDIWPELTGPYRPEDVASRWNGTRCLLHPDGTVLSTQAVERQYGDGQWTDRFGDQHRTVSMQDATGRLQIQHDGHETILTGLGRRCAWSLELEWIQQDGLHIRGFEALDAADGHLATIHRSYRNHQLAGIEVLRLTPGESHE